VCQTPHSQFLCVTLFGQVLHRKLSHGSHGHALRLLPSRGNSFRSLVVMKKNLCQDCCLLKVTPLIEFAAWGSLKSFNALLLCRTCPTLVPAGDFKGCSLHLIIFGQWLVHRGAVAELCATTSCAVLQVSLVCCFFQFSPCYPNNELAMFPELCNGWEPGSCRHK
jgi:hypothetical protein